MIRAVGIIGSNFSLNEMLKINEDPSVLSKQLQWMLLVLLKSDADPNFLRHDADLPKYLIEKVKPAIIEWLKICYQESTDHFDGTRYGLLTCIGKPILHQ
uniref:Uncharacterized protein n=1 Tax=Romanomermis culicivorax TaxID=13658 RepID=A0A915HHB7_ROMCU